MSATSSSCSFAKTRAGAPADGDHPRSHFDFELAHGKTGPARAAGTAQDRCACGSCAAIK
jgi:hypothetical protein